LDDGFRPDIRIRRDEAAAKTRNWSAAI
jgi:hypothetical protein